MKRYVTNQTVKNDEWIYQKGKWILKKEKLQVVKISESKPNKFSYIIFT